MPFSGIAWAKHKIKDTNNYDRELIPVFQQVDLWFFRLHLIQGGFRKCNKLKLEDFDSFAEERTSVSEIYTVLRWKVMIRLWYVTNDFSFWHPWQDLFRNRVSRLTSYKYCHKLFQKIFKAQRKSNVYSIRGTNRYSLSSTAPWAELDRRRTFTARNTWF